MLFYDWFFTGFCLIAFGILHETSIYWLQSKWRGYSRIFGDQAFVVYAVQLGGIWIVIGIWLIIVLIKMPPAPFYPSLVGLPMVGILGCLIGISMMLKAFFDLGWRRMMKYRLFTNQPLSWIHHGLYSWMKNPMYVGSQVAMFSLAFALNSWFLLVYTVEMVILQYGLARLENTPP